MNELKEKLKAVGAAKAAATGVLAAAEAAETAEKAPVEREAEKSNRNAGILVPEKSATAECVAAADEDHTKSDEARANECKESTVDAAAATSQRLAVDTQADKAAAEDEAAVTTPTLKKGKMYVQLCWVGLPVEK